MNKEGNLAALAKQIEICKRCNLYKETTHAVPGEGNPQAKIVFVGEAPGFHEDSLGRPFVGNAGKYLDLLISKVGLERDQVFITNVVKHRPPENRDPTPSEVASCNLWLEAQLKEISPAVVVTLGRWSLARYLPSAKISEVHGKPVKTQGVVVLPMYHPAAALRSGLVSRQLEEDFMKNQKLLSNPEEVGSLTENFNEDGQRSLF